jgi:hypothetical protein
MVTQRRIPGGEKPVSGTVDSAPETVDDFGAALEQFRLIANDLGEEQILKGDG